MSGHGIRFGQNMVTIPCSGGCGWDVFALESDPNPVTVCSACDPERSALAPQKCDCDGCNYGEFHSGIWTNERRN